MTEYMNTMYAVNKYDTSTRVIANRLKDGELEAMKIAAAQMAAYIPHDSVLVPIPSHHGYATTMLSLCHELSLMTGCKVYDVLRAKQRPTHYSVKMNGSVLSFRDLMMHTTADLPADKKVIVIDNVIDSGRTAVCAMHAIGDCMVLAYAATKELFKRYASLYSYSE